MVRDMNRHAYCCCKLRRGFKQNSDVLVGRCLVRSACRRTAWVQYDGRVFVVLAGWSLFVPCIPAFGLAGFRENLFTINAGTGDRKFGNSAIAWAGIITVER